MYVQVWCKVVFAMGLLSSSGGAIFEYEFKKNMLFPHYFAVTGEYGI